MNIDIHLESNAVSLCVVSGKGGSGKTLVATCMALGLASSDKRVLLIDADFGTGGLTYFLGFSTFRSTREGLSEYIIGQNPKIAPPISEPRSEAVDANPAIRNVRLLQVGEHTLVDEGRFFADPAKMQNLIHMMRSSFDFIIIDCRGGIDEDSLAICEVVDKIILVVETDAAAIRSTQHLTEILSRGGYGKKIGGFILNKVMDDPSQLANAGRSLFRAEYLGAIPFDIRTIRSFIRGQLPSQYSLLSRHVFRALSKIFPDIPRLAEARVLSPSEFSTISLRNPFARQGNTVLLGLSIYLVAGYIGYNYINHRTVSSIDAYFLAGSFFLLVFGLSDYLKEQVGRLLSPLALIKLFRPGMSDSS